MKKLIHIFLFLLIFPASFQAINITLKGRIIDSDTNYPLKGAEIYLVQTKCGAISNVDGNFLLLCKQISSDDTLIVEYLGYEAYRCHVTDFSNGSVIKLKPKDLTLKKLLSVQRE